MSNWEGIEEFVAVANSGSFVGAARVLGLSTSHISRAIMRLENRLQTQVLIRTTRKVALTDTGRILAEQFRRLIMDRQEAFAAVSDSGEPQGELRLTCSTGIGERFVAPIVRRFALTYPRLTVSIDLTNRVVDIISEGYDLAVRTGHLPDSSLVGTRIASRRLILCAAPAYLAAEGVPQSLEDLARHQCLTGTSGLWHFSNGTFRPRGNWRCNSGLVLAEAAMAGMGLCQLPEFYVLKAIAEGRLVPVLEALRPDEEPIWAVYPQRRYLLPKVRKLVEVLRAELGPALECFPKSVTHFSD